MIKRALLFLTMITILSCNTSKELPTVKNLDISKYSGNWYEIARLPNTFEKGLECVTANYSVKENGKIEVLNKGYSSENNGEFKTAKGTAWIPNAKYPGRLKVTFFWPFSGNYYIISLDEDYKYALVGDPSRKYLWILSRSRNLESPTYSKLLNIANANGFDISQVIKINQDCKIAHN